MMSITVKSAREVEVRCLLSSSERNRRHGALQGSLSSAMYLDQLIEPCAQLGLDFDIAVHSEASNVLWDQGDLSASINVLQDICHQSNFKIQNIPIGKAEVLGKLVRSSSTHRIDSTKLTVVGSPSLRGAARKTG